VDSDDYTVGEDLHIVDRTQFEFGNKVLLLSFELQNPKTQKVLLQHLTQSDEMSLDDMLNLIQDYHVFMDQVHKVHSVRLFNYMEKENQQRLAGRAPTDIEKQSYLEHYRFYSDRSRATYISSFLRTRGLTRRRYLAIVKAHSSKSKSPGELILSWNKYFNDPKYSAKIKAMK